MPQVEIKYHPQAVSDEFLLILTRSLPDIVAKAFHVEENKDAHLKPEDVGVRSQEHEWADINTRALEIVIQVHNYPERKANAQERIQQIKDELFKIDGMGKLFPTTFYIWVHFIDGAFKSFTK